MVVDILLIVRCCKVKLLKVPLVVSEEILSFIEAKRLCVVVLVKLPFECHDVVGDRIFLGTCLHFI